MIALQRQADMTYRTKRQTKPIITRIGENWAKARRGKTINKHESKRSVRVHGSNQGRFVDADKKKKRSLFIQGNQPS